MVTLGDMLSWGEEEKPCIFVLALEIKARLFFPILAHASRFFSQYH